MLLRMSLEKGNAEPPGTGLVAGDHVGHLLLEA